MSKEQDENSMISARGSAQRSGFGRGLLVLASVLLVIGVIGSILMPWSAVEKVRMDMARRAEESPNRFLAPGSLDVDLPAGRIFVEYFTDETLDDMRHITSSELTFDLSVTDASGTTIEVEHESTQRANLPSSRPGRSAAAILVGTAPIPAPGRHRITLSLPPDESSQAVAEILVINQAEQDQLYAAIWPGIGVGCGIAGSVFFGLTGLLALWVEKRAGMNR